MSLKVAFQTLGCKVNYYETEALREQFRKEGFSLVPFKAWADVYIINTCTVTHLADRKSRQIVRQARRQNPQGMVVVCGCYSQVEPDAVAALPGVDLVAGTTQRLILPSLIKKKLQGEEVLHNVQPYGHKGHFEKLPWTPEQDRTRAFLKIQDGCDRYCSYCVIPLARGPLRSLPSSQALQSLREIIDAGYLEIVLTGVHLGLYGVDLNPPKTLAALLNKAVHLPGIQRLRLSSIEPADFSEGLINVIGKNNNICPHLHIPLQSGDDTILRRMGRHYDTDYYRTLLNNLRVVIPDLAVSSDVIVGFPGETDKHFKNTLSFVEECGFSRLHVFPFSPRRGTRAEKMTPVVSPAVKKERSREMIALGKILSRKFFHSFDGCILPVLFEKTVKVKDMGEAHAPMLLEGLTTNYLRVRVHATADLRGQIRNVLLQSTTEEYLKGTIH